jgi:spermidine synthase
VALARQFEGRNERLYTDPRSQIHIDDAKAYFAATGRRYDLIVSEPSNPWVSGVAGLFSVEFYRHAVRHMAPDGLFAQWLQIYETHPDRVASVLKAVGEVFDDYLVVALDFGDILIVARPQGRIAFAREDSQRLSPQIHSWLRRLDIDGPSDLTLRVMGNKALFAPWLAQQAVPANSDFHPYIDTHADRDRFIGSGAAMQGIALSAYPIPELLGIRPPLDASAPLSLNPHFGPEPPARFARLIAQSSPSDGSRQFPGTPPAQLFEWQRQARQLLADCAEPPLNDAAYAISGLLIKVLPYLSVTEGRALITRMGQARCLTPQDEHQKAWLGLLDQLLERNPAGIGATAARLLDGNQGVTSVRARYLLGMALLGYLAAGDAAHARDIWARHAARAVGSQPLGIELQILRDYALAAAAMPARAIGQKSALAGQ